MEWQIDSYSNRKDIPKIDDNYTAEAVVAEIEDIHSHRTSIMGALVDLRKGQLKEKMKSTEDVDVAEKEDDQDEQSEAIVGEGEGSMKSIAEETTDFYGEEVAVSNFFSRYPVVAEGRIKCIEYSLRGRVVGRGKN